MLRPENRVIPLTSPGPFWSQREYLACLEMNIGFSAHRASDLTSNWHYFFPTEPACCTTIVVGQADIKSYHDHKFVPSFTDWIERCRKEMLTVV